MYLNKVQVNIAALWLVKTTGFSIPKRGKPQRIQEMFNISTVISHTLNSFVKTWDNTHLAFSWNKSKEDSRDFQGGGGGGVTAE